MMRSTDQMQRSEEMWQQMRYDQQASEYRTETLAAKLTADAVTTAASNAAQMEMMRQAMNNDREQERRSALPRREARSSDPGSNRTQHLHRDRRPADIAEGHGDPSGRVERCDPRCNGAYVGGNHGTASKPGVASGRRSRDRESPRPSADGPGSRPPRTTPVGGTCPDAFAPASP